MATDCPGTVIAGRLCSERRSGAGLFAATELNANAIATAKISVANMTREAALIICLRCETQTPDNHII
jgi:hypothetical protein